MQIGLLGKANVGKSTFFSAATQTQVATGNFPFTTVQPNVGVAYAETKCPCRELGVEHDSCSEGTRLIPIRLIDIAGLVPGAHQGRGLGNQFLDDARQAVALIQVVDIAGATDIEGQPVPPGSHDPLEDVKFVQDEFDQWFLQILMREWEKLKREIVQKKTSLANGIARRFSGLGVDEDQVRQALLECELLTRKPNEWTDQNRMELIVRLRRMTRPMIIAANKADLCKDLSTVGDAVPCSAEAELLLRRASKAGLVDYVSGSGTFAVRSGINLSSQQTKALDTVRGILSRIGTTGVQKVLNSVIFDVLKMVAVYPVEDETRLTNRDGRVLPDVKLLPPSSGPRDLAALIHADIEKGFLYAIDCKTRQRIGASYKLKDGDVIKIVSAGSRGA